MGVRLLVVAALLALISPLAAQHEPPRLVVVLVADQFRADYPTLYGHQWTRGLRRLFDTGAVFPLAEYPYALTVTCAGYATIATGALPETHGMVGNEWYDRRLGKQVRCTEDASATSVPLDGGPGAERHGPGYLRVNTLADELRAQRERPSTVVSLSQKPRSAITMAGRPGPSTYVVWIEGNGSWATSSAYTPTAWPAVNRWAVKHPISADYGRIWDRLLPVDQYRFVDDAPGEAEPRTFPHRLVSPNGVPDSAFATTWSRSPVSDAALGTLAQRLVTDLKMGQTPGGTDYLAISFAALDHVGHRFGPHSHEVQDTLAHLDRTLGALLTMLDETVGRDQYVVAFSADHGVSPLPERMGLGTPAAGRYTTANMRAVIETALTPFLGEGPHVLTSVGANVYLQPAALDGLRRQPSARAALRDALTSMPAIDRVYFADELSARGTTDDVVLRMARRSYFPGNSGDLMLILSPFWMAQSTSSMTTHGTPWGYDTRVPVLFAGAGITPGRHLDPASPADIAPTLAAVLGLTLTRVDGHPLTPALRSGK
ncbi:MAG: hypothetical protein FJW21_03195 [Acidimicrobiia bacterium]|nr:hypothetical protein [Acidimicrobiia bacterium]